MTGNAFDVAIGGLPFVMAVTDSTPYKRQTAEFRAQRVDQMRDPGEHTLAGSGYWTRSQSSFHYGDGINFTEPMEGNDSEVRFRYKDGYGINPWVPGQLTLLKSTTLVQAFTGKCKLDTGATDGVDFLIATDMAGPVSTTAAATAATSATTISVASTAGIVVGYVVNDGAAVSAGTTVTAIGTGTITISAGLTTTLANGTTLKFAPSNLIYKINSSNTSTALVTWASLNYETILATTSDGTYLYVATTGGIYDIKMSDGTTHKSYNYGALTAAHAVLKYVKSRIVGAGAFTNGAYAAYELLFPSKGSGASVEIKPTMTAADGTLISGSTNMPVGWQWNCITESRNAIYLGGYAGEHSTVFKLTVDSTGALGTIVTTAVLPRGEVIRSLYSYLGSYVMIGTSKGARVATSDSNGDLTYGPIAYHNENGVYDFEARDSYVWCGATNGVNSNSGTYRINLAQPITLAGYAQPIATGVYAKASDVFANATTGTVWGVRIYDTNRVAFAIEGSGIWIEHKTDLIPQGEIRTGYIRFDTLENKAWKRIRVRTPGDVATGEIEVFRHAVDTDTLITTIDTGDDTSIDYDLNAVFQTIAPDAAFKLELYRNATDATTGAVVTGIGVKALPTPTRARILQIPVFCYDKETDKNGNIIGYEGYAKDRLVALETSEARGDTLIIQDFNAGGDPFEVVVEQITFTRATPANRNYSGFGGIIQIIARTVV